MSFDQVDVYFIFFDLAAHEFIHGYYIGNHF